MLLYLTGNVAWVLDHNIGSALQRGCIANVLPSGYARWQERCALFPWPSQRPQSVFLGLQSPLHLGADTIGLIKLSLSMLVFLLVFLCWGGANQYLATSNQNRIVCVVVL